MKQVTVKKFNYKVFFVDANIFFLFFNRNIKGKQLHVNDVQMNTLANNNWLTPQGLTIL